MSRAPAEESLPAEVLALGVSTVTVHPDIDSTYLSVSGTSLSTPLVAGTVALLIEAHPTWTVADIRYALESTASNFSNPDFAQNVTGFGVINAFAALNAQVPEPASILWLLAGAPLLLLRRRVVRAV